jgi:hypothetical protein
MSFERLSNLDANAPVFIAKVVHHAREVAADMQADCEEERHHGHLARTRFHQTVDSFGQPGSGRVQESRAAEREASLGGGYTGEFPNRCVRRLDW